MAKPHPLEAAFVASDKVALPEGGVARPLTYQPIPIQWAPSNGLWLVDLFGVADPVEVPLPALAQMPPLRLTTWNGEIIFLSQRFRESPSVSWEEVGAVAIDRAAFCVTPRDFSCAPAITEALEDSLNDADGAWAHLDAAGTTIVGIKTNADGLPSLYLARGADGISVGWVLNVASVEIPWKLRPDGVPPELSAFIKPQIRYVLAARKAPTTTRAAIMASLGVPDRMQRGNPGKWDRAGVGRVLIKEVDSPDYHFYVDGLRRVGVVQPALLLIVMFEYQHLTSVPDSEWRAMLAAMAALARDTHGVLFRPEADGWASHDFAG